MYHFGCRQCLCPLQEPSHIFIYFFVPFYYRSQDHSSQNGTPQDSGDPVVEYKIDEEEVVIVRLGRLRILLRGFDTQRLLLLLHLFSRLLRVARSVHCERDTGDSYVLCYRMKCSGKRKLNFRGSNRINSSSDITDLEFVYKQDDTLIPLDQS